MESLYTNVVSRGVISRSSGSMVSRPSSNTMLNWSRMARSRLSVAGTLLPGLSGSVGSAEMPQRPTLLNAVAIVVRSMSYTRASSAGDSPAESNGTLLPTLSSV